MKCCICKGVINPLFYAFSQQEATTTKEYAKKLEWWLKCFNEVRKKLGPYAWREEPRQLI